MKEIEILISPEDDGLRLDVYISKETENLSRSLAQKLISDGFVKINGDTSKPSSKVSAGQRINILIPDPKNADILPENIDIEILYEDDDIAVINKPKGMVVHPACGNYKGTLVNALLYKCDKLSGINGVIRPGIVHRIDKDTSGVLVIAKNDNAHYKLSQQLKDHSMKRKYIALVYGRVKNNNGTISTQIGRHKIDRKKMAVLKIGGRHAVTHYNVLDYYKDYTLIEAVLETGRTHQIRVHMAHIGHPLVGDEIYGPKKQKEGVKGQMLHAQLLGFSHPVTGLYLEFKTPLPNEFEEFINKLKKL